MKLYLNDLSINGQCKDKQDAIILLKQMTKTFVEAKQIAENEDGYFHDSILERILYQDITLKHFLTAILQDAEANDKDIKRICHSIIFRKPKKSVENSHCEPGEIINAHGWGEVNNTCFDCACNSKAGALFVSMENNSLSAYNKFQIDSTKYGKKIIYNIHKSEDVQNLMWHYEHNPKHGVKDKVVNNKVESGMPLSIDKIRYTLRNGVMVKDKIYGHYDDCIYKFHCHEKNKYHAFSYTLKDNDVDDNLAKEILNNLDGERMGQVFSECI